MQLAAVGPHPVFNRLTPNELHYRLNGSPLVDCSPRWTTESPRERSLVIVSLSFAVFALKLQVVPFGVP